MTIQHKEDDRPMRGLWAPGVYSCKCTVCGDNFLGDRRAMSCADCAYKVPIEETPYDRRVKWDHRFLKLARHISSWSKDPSTKVGSVIVRPDLSVASMGYNGFVRGFPDTEEVLQDREQKYRFIVHGEANAIVHAREPLHGCTLYVWPFPPCDGCVKLAIQAGIKRFVSVRPTREQRDRWGASFEAAEDMICETKLDATWYDPVHFND